MTAQTQTTQTPSSEAKTNPLKNLFLSKRKAIESLVSDSIKRKYPGFVNDLIGSFVDTISKDQNKPEFNLKNTSSDSMLKGIYFCARKGLSLSQKQVHLAVFKRTLTPIIGVEGYRELIRRNPRVLKVGVYVVRNKDDFKLSLGTNPYIHHEPNIFEESPIIGSYAYAELRDGGSLPIFYNKKQLDKARNESKSSFAQNLWGKYEEEMSKVLPLRKLGKELGVDTDLESVETAPAPYNDNVVPFTSIIPDYNYQSLYQYDYEGETPLNMENKNGNH